MPIYQIDLKYACFGIVVLNDVVTAAPPIARWMKGKKLVVVQTWVLNKGGTIIKISP